MLDEESDKPFVRTERRAMNADRCLVSVVPVFVAKIKIARLREIDLVGRDGKLAADHAPCLNVDLRAVEGGFVRHFDIIDSGILENVTSHFLSLFPKLRFIDKFLAELGRIMR